MSTDTIENQKRFNYVPLSRQQQAVIDTVGDLCADLTNVVNKLLPENSSKQMILEHIRSAYVWTNQSITEGDQFDGRTYPADRQRDNVSRL